MSEMTANMSAPPVPDAPTLDATYPVAWRQVFKSVFIYIFLAIFVPVTAIMAIRYVTSGFDYETTFKHLTLRVFLLLQIGNAVFSVTLAFLVASFMRLAAITIADGVIHGRTYWGAKGKIPLSDITELCAFSNNGINAIVVHSKYHGKIYISDKTERLEELLEILARHLPEEENAGVGGIVPAVQV